MSPLTSSIVVGTSAVAVAENGTGGRPENTAFTVKLPTEIQTRNDGQRAFYINDPDGNRIELCTKSGFGVLV